MRDRRDDVIRAHWELAVRHSGETIEGLATRAVEVYESRTPLHARRIAFQPMSRDPYAAQRANATHVRRFLGLSEPATRLPVELEEALVLALPDPFRAECLRELADRVGLLAAKAPDPQASPLLVPADLMRECADVITALAPALCDGTYTAADLPAIREALGALADVSGAVASLRHQLCDAELRLAPSTGPRVRAAGEVA
jgi:hypothetical protein